MVVVGVDVLQAVVLLVVVGAWWLEFGRKNGNILSRVSLGLLMLQPFRLD